MKKPLTQEEIDFFGGFQVTTDYLTVDLQLRKICDKVFEGLKRDLGAIIPKQSKPELIKRFTEAINSIEK